MNQEKYFTQFLLYFLIMMFLIVSGCSSKDDTVTYTISGTITGSLQSGVKLTLSGGATGTVMTGSDGTYSFANVIGGTTYIVTPSLSGYTFSPEYSEFTITSKDAANIDFTSSL